MEPSWPVDFSPSIVRDARGPGRLSSFVVALEAWRRGLEVSLLDSYLGLVEISDGESSIVFNHSCPISRTPREAQLALRDKWVTKRRLSEVGVPTPVGEVFELAETPVETILDFVGKIGFPVVMKPVDGSKGVGVHVNIASERELREVFHHLRDEEGYSQLLIEEHRRGDDYRVLVLGDQVLAACRRIPANILGDGRSTVQELIDQKNAGRKRNPFLAKGLIKIDFEVRNSLTEQNISLDSVPNEGERVFLRRIANASAGGDVIDCSRTLPDEILEAAVEAVRAFPGILLAGVDVLYETGMPANSSTFSVIEMNYRPHIAVNMYPSEGTGQDIPLQLVDYFFPASERARGDNIQRTAFDVRSGLMHV